MMKIRFAILLATFLFACNSNTVLNEKSSIISNENLDTSGSDIALKFMNDYVKFCSLESSPVNDSAWIEQNTLLTNNFKVTYHKLLDDAAKEDPELGLDFDPIFDAQDFPDNGFEPVNWDTASGYVAVRGIEKVWRDFTVVLKVVSQNNKWLVDGAGIVNIPEAKRAKR